jgi:phosphonate transport system substrate-binding protein
MAENTEFFCQSIAAYLQANLGIQTDYVSALPWQERERLFDEGKIDILWLCGLPYVDKADLYESEMELLAVPVPAGSRYCGQPVYFSDVIVREKSRFRSFEELRGAGGLTTNRDRTPATMSFEPIYPDWVKREASLARLWSRVPIRSLCK